jgi:hypothetical protein
MLEVTLSNFVPSPDDALSYPWQDFSGQEHVLEMPLTTSVIWKKLGEMFFNICGRRLSPT